MFFHEKTAKNADLQNHSFRREWSKFGFRLFHSCGGCFKGSAKKARDALFSLSTKVPQISGLQDPKIRCLGIASFALARPLPHNNRPCGQLDYTRRGRWPARAQPIYENSSSGVGYTKRSGSNQIKTLQLNLTTFLKRHERVIIGSNFHFFANCACYELTDLLVF